MTDGSRDLLDEIRALVAEVGTPAELDVMTGSVNPKHAAALAAMREGGEVSTLRVVVDAGFLAKRDKYEQPAHAAVDDAVGRDCVRAVRTHAKAVRAHGPAGHGVIICSANLNANRSVEFYERADSVAPIIKRVIDGIFDRIQPGCVGVSQSVAGAALREAVSGFRQMGVHVYDTQEPLPKSVLAGNLDTLVVMRGGALGGFLPAALAQTGTPARLWSSGINIQTDQIHYLAREVAAGRIADLRLYLPPALGVKRSSESIHASLCELVPEVLVWADTHAKALLVEGPRGVVCCTGSAQLAGTGALEFVRVTTDRPTFDHVAGMLATVAAESDPPPPDEEALQKARARYEASTPGHSRPSSTAAGTQRFEVTARTIAVSDRFQPPTGLGASTAELEDELLRLDLLESLPLFVQYFWPFINKGTPLTWNWHLDELCHHYAAFVHGTCAETTVNANPPGATKSTIVSQFGPVWGMLHYPHFRWGFASHSLDQAIKDNAFRRDTIALPEFQRIFRPSWSVIVGKDAKKLFVNTVGGSMRATSTGAKITGDHFNRKIGDDLLDGKDRAKPETAVDWTFNVFLTRSRDGSLNWLNGQRLHPLDPSGFALEKANKNGTLGKAGPGGVDYLCFPHHYAPDDPTRRCCTSTGAGDRRTRKGELLWPARFPAAWLAAKAQDMAPIAYATQYEQDVNIDAVRIFPAEWWQRFEVDPGGGWLEVSVDSSNWSERKAADLTSITLARVVNGRLYRLRCWSGRFTLPQAVEIVAKISLEYPTVRRWHVEDKAGGKGFMQAMKAGGEVGGQKWAISPFAIEAVNPQAMGGDLTFRADAAAPAVRAGKCYVLSDKEGDAFIATCAAFPAVHPDDDVASWVQLATDKQISKHLGSRRATAMPPGFSVPTAEVERRRQAVRGLPARR